MEPRYDEVLDMLTKQAEQLIVGSAFENHTATNVDIGPLISLKAVEKLHRLLHDALEKGAQLESGAPPDITTQFVQPDCHHTHHSRHGPVVGGVIWSENRLCNR